MTVRPRSGGWQADLTHGGERYRAQFPTEQAALSWEADTKAALIAGRPLPKAPTGVNGEVTMAALLKMTTNEYWKGQKNEERATFNAQCAVDFFGAHTSVREISSARVSEYKAFLSEQPRGPATINRYLAALSKMMTHALRIEAIDKKPFIHRSKEGGGRERYLLEHEAEALIKLLRHWGKDVEATYVTFLLDTGARMGEGLQLRVRDVADDRATLGAVSSKNGEWRVVPLTRRLREQLPPLKVGRENGDKLFDINRATFQGIYRRAVDHLNLGDDVVIHTLRHTCASWLVQRGVDIRRVQKWMGHKSITVTLKYAKLAPTDLFDSVSVLDDPPPQQRPKLRAVS